MNQLQSDKAKAKLTKKLEAIKPKINESIKKINENRIQKYDYILSLIDEISSLIDTKDIKNKDLIKANLSELRLFNLSQKLFYTERMTQDLID